jgi:hypothetical protein
MGPDVTAPPGPRMEISANLRARAMWASSAARDGIAEAGLFTVSVRSAIDVAFRLSAGARGALILGKAFLLETKFVLAGSGRHGRRLSSGAGGRGEALVARGAVARA